MAERSSFSIRPQIVALLALILSAGLVWGGQPRAGSADPTSSVPTVVGPWVGTSLETPPNAVEILETSDVNLMEYRAEGEQPLWLAHVGGVGRRAAFHPPELCYVGSHYEVLERSQITIPVRGEARRVMRLVIGRGAARYEAWYWLTANERMTPSYYQQQWWLLMDAIRGRPMAGTLVRITTPLDDPSRSYHRLLGFVEALES